MRCIPDGFQQMPANHANHHHPLPIHNSDISMGAMVAPLLPRHQATPDSGAPHNPAPAAREPWAEQWRMAAPPAAQDPRAEPARIAASPVAQDPLAELVRWAVGAPEARGT